MNDWNPEQYLKYKSERTRPSMDLVSRIKIKTPRNIIDIGCGPGNSTQILLQRWPSAKIVGLDHSEEMIKKARQDYPRQKWLTADVSLFESDILYCIVFSNACLHWVPHHDVVIPRLFEFVRDRGAIAVQVPSNHKSPLHKALVSVSSDKKWHRYTKGCERLLHHHPPQYYYELLTPIASSVDLWETIYYHILPSHEGLIEWSKGTAMKPYLDRLPDEGKRNRFEREVLAGCKDAYKVQKDGSIIYPFKRLFFIAYK